MSDDEDLNELRRMRAGKAALDGPLGDKLAELRRRQAAASRDQSSYFDDGGAGPSGPSGSGPQRSKPSSAFADDDDDDDTVRAKETLRPSCISRNRSSVCSTA